MEQESRSAREGKGGRRTASSAGSPGRRLRPARTSRSLCRAWVNGLEYVLDLRHRRFWHVHNPDDAVDLDEQV